MDITKVFEEYKKLNNLIQLWNKIFGFKMVILL